MNWKTFWQQQGKQEDPLLQVGRKGGLHKQDDEWLVEYAAYIAQQLQLTRDDIVLDVCCGNGLLTHYLAKHCKAIMGIDFSEEHINTAQKKYSGPRIQFKCVDVLELEKTVLESGYFEQGFTKAVLCFSFQYFESVQAGLQVVSGVFKHAGQSLFLTDIPNRNKFFVYYDSPLKLAKLIKQMLFQQNDMGKFWSENELDFIAKSVSRNGKKIRQPASFPYAHYRMDYLLSENPAE